MWISSAYWGTVSCFVLLWYLLAGRQIENKTSVGHNTGRNNCGHAATPWWAEQGTCEPECLKEPQGEPERARVSQREKEWDRVDQREPEWVRASMHYNKFIHYNWGSFVAKRQNKVLLKMSVTHCEPIKRKNMRSKPAPQFIRATSYSSGHFRRKYWANRKLNEMAHTWVKYTSQRMP